MAHRGGKATTDRHLHSIRTSFQASRTLTSSWGSARLTEGCSLLPVSLLDWLVGAGRAGMTWPSHSDQSNSKVKTCGLGLEFIS